MIDFLLRATTGHHSDLPPAFSLSPHAQRIALPRRLHLDDLGAHVAEQLAAERTREQRAELDDAQIGERTVREALVGHAAPRCVQRANCGCFGGSSPVSALQRAFSSSIVSKPRSNSCFAPRSLAMRCAQSRRRLLVDAVIVIEHDAVATRAFDA